jgi:hypothetical protein
MLFEELLPLIAGKLGALIGVHMDFDFGFAPPDSHQQGLQRQIGIGPALHRPAARQRFACKPQEGANDAPRKQVILARYLAMTDALSSAAIRLFENAPETALASRMQTKEALEGAALAKAKGNQ